LLGEYKDYLHFHVYTDFELLYIEDDKFALTGMHKEYDLGRCMLFIGSEDLIHGMKHDLKKQAIEEANKK
jgi:hypothetical protein